MCIFYQQHETVRLMAFLMWIVYSISPWEETNVIYAVFALLLVLLMTWGCISGRIPTSNHIRFLPTHFLCFIFPTSCPNWKDVKQQKKDSTELLYFTVCSYLNQWLFGIVWNSPRQRLKVIIRHHLLESITGNKISQNTVNLWN